MAELDQRLQGALEDLQGYLADNLAPLLVADAFETLLEYPPALTAEQLRIWSFFQFQGRGGVTPISDILYHAIKKIQTLEIHHLVPQDRFEGFLGGVAIALLEVCPDAERERLAGLLRHLRESVGGATALVERIHRAGGPGAPPAGPAMAPQAGMMPGSGAMQMPAMPAMPGGSPLGMSGSMAAPIPGSIGASADRRAYETAPAAPTAEEIRDLRRFTLALERAVAGLTANAVVSAAGAVGASAHPAGAAPGGENTAQQLLVLATAGARNDADLEARLAKLREAGVAAPPGPEVLKALIGAVPDWTVALPGAKAPSTGSIEAVRKVVKLGADKWTELLKSSAEQFNAGSFGRSVALVDLAERMLKEGEVDVRTAEIARGNGHEAYEVTKLLQAAADRRNWPVLHRLLEFYPAWSVRDLLDSLTFQPDTKKRRLLIAMLEIWGAPARPLILERLDTSVMEGSRDENAWWYQRNLVFLLHRIPRVDDVDIKREIDLISPFSGLMHHPSFQKETILLLSILPGYAGVPTLVQRLGEAEKALESQAPVHPVEELWRIESALTSALIRSGSLSARRIVLDHALARRPKDGDTLGRLKDFGRIDLADDRDTHERLLAALRELAPRRVFGLVMGRREEEVASVARALVSTTTTAARQALAEVKSQFPDLVLEKPTVSTAHDAQGAPHEPSAPEPAEGDTEKFAAEAAPLPGRGSLSGDLELFGLAGLLQTFQQTETTGRLTLKEPKGQPFAEIALHRGQIADCRAGKLSGTAAFYQLLEVPGTGTFEFVRAEPSKSAPPGAKDMMGLLLEGMRRYDELQRLRVVVPDTLLLRPGASKPTPPEEEKDGDFMRQVWERVRNGGARAIDCEAAFAVDSYRVRALLAHWLETGAAAVAAA